MACAFSSSAWDTTCKAFEDFKKANEEKLKAKADVILGEKVQRIDDAVGNFQ